MIVFILIKLFLESSALRERDSQKDHCDKLQTETRTKGSGLIVWVFFSFHIRSDLFHFCVRRQELLSDSCQTLLAAMSLPISF